MALIYHLAVPSDWEYALDHAIYVPPNFEEEGFIHCSTKEQLLRSATRFFADHSELVVLEMSERQASIKPALKWEPAENGERFPHIYAKLPILAVENTRMLFRNRAGEWEFD